MVELNKKWSKSIDFLIDFDFFDPLIDFFDLLINFLNLLIDFFDLLIDIILILFLSFNQK